MRPALLSLATALPLLLPATTPAQQPTPADTTAARVVILGTGTPNADPDRWGPAVAVVAGGQAYLVDAGAGVVRRAAAAARDHEIDALSPEGLDRLFVTHLHSDHTVGLPDLILSPWVLDRPEPLLIFGPPGTSAMATHIGEAWREDIHMRLFGLEPRDANADAYRAPVTETTGGPVYEDEHVRVTAIPVLHGSWPHALGYRFDARGRSIVISGDARPSESLVEACDGCDVLLHEVYSAEAFQRRPPPVEGLSRPLPHLHGGAGRVGGAGPAGAARAVSPALLGRHRRGPGARDEGGRVHRPRRVRSRPGRVLKGPPRVRLKRPGASGGGSPDRRPARSPLPRPSPVARIRAPNSRSYRAGFRNRSAERGQ